MEIKYQISTVRIDNAMDAVSKVLNINSIYIEDNAEFCTALNTDYILCNVTMKEGEQDFLIGIFR